MSIPLFLVGFTFVWTLMLISLTSESFALWFGGISLVIAVVLAFFERARRDKTVIVALLSVAFACAIFLLKSEFYYKPALNLCDSVAEVKGQVVGFDTKSDSGADRYIVKVTEGPLKGYKIRLSSKYATCELCDYVSLKGKIYELNSSLKAKDLYVGTYTYGDIEITPCDNPTVKDKARLLSYNVRNYLESELKRYLPKDYSLTLLGMLVGEKSKLPDEIYESFQKTGIVHLLAVSGFHTTLWSMIIYRFLLKRGLGLKVSSIISILFVLLFMGLTGFSKSTIRAGIMIIIFFFGRVVSRQPDSKNSLGFSAIIIILLNPFVGGDTGFLLSFFSTLGILVVFPELQRKVRPLLKRTIHNFILRQKIDDIISVVLVTLSTLCFTLPLIMLLIGDMSVVSPLTNLLTTSVASTAIFFSGVAVIISKIPVLCAFENPLLLISGFIMKYVIYISTMLSNWSFASISLENDFIYITVSAVIILIGFSIMIRASKKRTILLGAMIFIVSIITHYLV